MRVTTGWIVCTLLAPAATAQLESVVDSPHNLSASGPGTVRAATEDQVCIFCHAPHNATPVRPLWNRTTPLDTYSIYTSRALDAEPGQPTGMSKMCLSCHDGTIALGNVASRSTPIQMSGGVGTLPLGPGHLGTDLSDDHPISFTYDSALAAVDPKLKDPALLPEEVSLDSNSELQCTSCHDAHNNVHGSFLVMEDVASQLCTSCHQMGATTITGHETCAACHQPHSAPSGPYLLREATVADTCMTCHDGGHAGAPNIEPDLSDPYVHETYSPTDPPLPLEEHTSCVDCHEPHTIHSGSAAAPALSPRMGAIDGVNSSGSPVDLATYEYEVCFKCHADSNTRQPWISRIIAENNTRLEFDPGAVSFHPVETQGRNPDVPSLKPGWTTSSLVRCSDCHGSTRGPAGGGTGPEGVHGSSEAPILVANYSTADYTQESTQAYALCYLCHDRDSILNDESFDEHSKHIRGEDAPCAACHDAHGISSHGSFTGNSHLINFNTNIVFPNSQGRLEFVDTGTFRGACYLTCHGERHSPENYP